MCFFPQYPVLQRYRIAAAPHHFLSDHEISVANRSRADLKIKSGGLRAEKANPNLKFFELDLKNKLLGQVKNGSTGII
jgi:hypothetical protein